MRPLFALPIGALVSACALACGHADPQTGATRRLASTDAAGGAHSTRDLSSGTNEIRRSGVDDYDDDDGYEQTIRSDGDSDDGARTTDVDGDSDSTRKSAYDRDDGRIRGFGRAATVASRRQIASLIKSYYASAVAGDGARACSLVYRSLARTFSQDLGQGGPRYLRGLRTCATVLSKVFSDNHLQLAAYAAQLELREARVAGGLGIAVLASGQLPGRQIEVIREHGVWKIFALTDKELP